MYQETSCPLFCTTWTGPKPSPVPGEPEAFIAEFGKVQNPVSSANKSDMFKKKNSLEFHTLLLMVQKS